MNEPGDWGDGPEDGRQPTVGDHGTCRECGEELTRAVVGDGPMIEGVIMGKAIDWVHSDTLRRIGPVEVVPKTLPDIDLQWTGHHAELGGPA